MTAEAEEARGLIDVHSHFLTDHYVRAAITAGHEWPDGIDAWPSWDVTSHLKLMDSNAIAHSVLSISSPGIWFGDAAQSAELARHVNDEAASIAAAYPCQSQSRTLLLLRLASATRHPCGPH
tara:strand:+ start:3004 stop:3369 length:366 start_codon:yes stop_codon:yes gene_type:complete